MEKIKQHYVYMITNLLTGLKYIGYHYGFTDDDYLGSGVIMKKVLKKNHRMNFKKKILHVYPSEKHARAGETHYIHEYHTISPLGYNISHGSYHGKITRDRISISKLIDKHKKLKDNAEKFADYDHNEEIRKFKKKYLPDL